MCVIWINHFENVPHSPILIPGLSHHYLIYFFFLLFLLSKYFFLMKWWLACLINSQLYMHVARRWPRHIFWSSSIDRTHKVQPSVCKCLLVTQRVEMIVSILIYSKQNYWWTVGLKVPFSTECSQWSRITAVIWLLKPADMNIYKGNNREHDCIFYTILDFLCLTHDWLLLQGWVWNWVLHPYAL